MRREALGEFSAKQLRLMMCLQQWGGGMSYGPQSREAMRARERELREFFLDMDVAARDVAAAVAGGATVPSSFEVSALSFRTDGRTRCQNCGGSLTLPHLFHLRMTLPCDWLYAGFRSIG